MTPGLTPLARLLTLLVVVYRRVVSAWLGPRCRFEPSCSAYAVDALRERGAVRGSLLILWRLLRCQPFGTPGYDPVPPRPLRAERAGAGRRAGQPC